jgi:sugar phosphate isomerase/epimerase
VKLGLMVGAIGEMVAAEELRSLGFEAVQAFFGEGPEGDAKDPTPDELDALLRLGDVALAAMTLHVDLVGVEGTVRADVDRAIRCVKKTAALEGRFGDNEKPLLIWHPSAYPEALAVDDRLVIEGVCDALSSVCEVAEGVGVNVAVEITRAGSIGSAERYLRVKDRVGSDALRVCMDAANFTPDRTPLERAVRVLGPDTVIIHGKDMRFDETGKVSAYGPTGSGTLDYPTYVSCVKDYVDAPYFVLEYYRSREDLLRARDFVRRSL